MSKKRIRIKSPSKRTLFLLLAGLVCIGVVLSVQIYHSQILSFDSLPLNSQTDFNRAASHMPQSIEITRLAIRLDVKPAFIYGRTWQINKSGASYLTASQRPGEHGNVVIYAHNKRDLFGPLQLTKIGDPITIWTRDGKEYSYKVVKTLIVAPSQVNVLKSNGIEELTLFTCTGFADTKRLVVKAILL